MKEPSGKTSEQQVYTPVDEASLADDEDAQSERGRIGYGRNERKSSWMLGLALVAVIALIGIVFGSAFGFKLTGVSLPFPLLHPREGR